MINIKEDKIKIARNFCKEVNQLAKKYNLPYFVVTDGASSTCNNGCSAVKNARDHHVQWELNNGMDPYEDWNKNISK